MANVETYLRCRVEDALQPSHPSTGEDVARMARAAVAAGLADMTQARDVLTGLGRAERLRSGEQHWDGDEDEDADEERVVVCPLVLTPPWGQVAISHAIIGHHSVELGLTGRVNDEGALPAGRHRGAEWPTEITAVDDQGHQLDGHFNGGGSNQRFEGSYHLHSPIHRDVRWIELFGERIDLTQTAEPGDVRVDALEQLTTQERARRHLRLSAGPSFGPWEDDDSVERDFFVAVGVLDGSEDDPDDSEDSEDAADAPVPAGSQGVGSQGVLYAGVYSPLGPRRRRRRHVGGGGDEPPTGVTVALVSPRLDGSVVSIPALWLRGRSVRLSCSLRTRGGLPHSDRPVLRVSAVDDVGTTYTAETGGGSGGGRSWREDLHLHPDLDPAATSLTLHVDLLRHRVSIDVPLPGGDA